MTGACCWTVHKLPLSNMLHAHKINPIHSNRLDFALIKTCDQLDVFAMGQCLLFNTCISVENLARQMPETS